METDLHLLTRYHRTGDADAFQRLVDAHADMVHATARRVTQDAVLAQDVAQETFLALARGGGAAIQCVSAWLHQVASRKAMNAVRSESRRQRQEKAAAEQLHEGPAEASWEALEPVLDEVLEELPAAARELLIERYLQGRSQQEMAQRRGIHQSTVSRQAEEALEQLRARLRVRGLALAAGGLAGLLSTQMTEAAPATLRASLGKLTYGGGVAATAAVSTPFLALLMKTLATKTAAAGAALLICSLASYDLAGPDPWLLGWRHTADLPALSGPRSEDAEAPDSTAAGRTRGPAVSQTASLPPATDTPEERLARLASLRRVKDFKDFMASLAASKDPMFVAKELQRRMGLDMGSVISSRTLSSPGILEMAVLNNLSLLHAGEALQWLATLDGDSFDITERILANILHHPDEVSARIGKIPSVVNLTESQLEAQHAANLQAMRKVMETGLPEGPNRDYVLSLLRAHDDPLSEAGRLLPTLAAGTVRRQKTLAALAHCWPRGQTAAAMDWALQNLQGNDLSNFISPLMVHLGRAAPDEAVAALHRISENGPLYNALSVAMFGLMEQHQRTQDVIGVIDKLEGPLRAAAIKGLARRWVRQDEEGLMQWINQLRTPEDFEATLQATLQQLKPENYARAMKTLMPQLDGKLDKALIHAARPDPLISNRTDVSVDIVQRLTQLPQYASIGSGQTGNQEALWQTVNDVARRWVQWNHGNPQEAARWIDSLPFARAADKAEVAGRLYLQWKTTDPVAAAAWAARAGVKVP